MNPLTPLTQLSKGLAPTPARYGRIVTVHTAARVEGFLLLNIKYNVCVRARAWVSVHVCLCVFQGSTRGQTVFPWSQTLLKRG